MEMCPVCDSGLLVVKTSSVGKEAFCSSCRRIVESASFGFKFAAEGAGGVVECRGGDNRPGWKGPGKRARCFTYTEGEKEEEARARQKAKDSAYAYQHARGASKIIHAVGYFTGAEGMSSPTMGTQSMGESGRAVSPGGTPENPMGPGPRPNPVSPMMQPGKSPMGVGGTGMSGEVPAAPGGIQPGNLNGPNPLNSGTTASVTPRLAQLINKLINVN